MFLLNQIETKQLCLLSSPETTHESSAVSLQFELWRRHLPASPRTSSKKALADLSEQNSTARALPFAMRDSFSDLLIDMARSRASAMADGLRAVIGKAASPVISGNDVQG